MLILYMKKIRNYICNKLVITYNFYIVESKIPIQLKNDHFVGKPQQ